MTTDLRAAYPAVTEVICVPNSWSLAEIDPAPAGATDRLRLSITHMSNLSSDKGLGRAVNAFRNISDQFDVTLQIAGPFADAEAKALVEAACREFGDRVRYWGEVSGVDKARLLRETDVFLFPSSYVNEAAPLVVDEALGAGSLVVCSPVGCLEELRHKRPSVHLVESTDHNALLQALAAALTVCKRNRRSAASEARALFQERRDDALLGLQRLLDELSCKRAVP